ncbi:LytTR family DNA-binding domain-containing protein [Anaerosporobacter faecicola]|uniref:LytTR family DNA-binding domain-containing protein n=1 Tax=Anaerosporobacter faecicola TaxID=2718714 RepID=UPI00143B8FE9|nr:LytTR family DNA-binding domain-containing protein [Anaerosporobacter faecicola]
MKIKLIIDKRYEEPQVHICNNEMTQEVKFLYKTIDSTLNQGIKAYQDDSIVMLANPDIIHIYTQDSKVYVTAVHGTYRLQQRLYELEQQLDKTLFIRISNSEIVNIKKIKRMDTSLTGTIRMYLEGEKEAYVSRRYVSKIKKALGI